MKKIILLLLLSIVPFNSANSAAPSRTYTYTSLEVIQPSEVTTNEDNVYNYLQQGVEVYKDGSIATADIADSAITTAKINNSAVTAAKIDDSAITSSKIVDDTITNSDINSSAAITYSKLSLSNSIVNADINSSAAIVASKLDLTSPGAIGSTSANTGKFTTATVDALTATANLDIGSYELRAQTFNSDVTTGTAPLTVASTTVVTNLNADQVDGYGVVTSATANSVYASGADTYLPDATVDTTALKTTTGEVSTADGGATFSEAKLCSGDCVNQTYVSNIFLQGSGSGANLTLPGGTYGFYPLLKDNASNTQYAQQRYVTASGEDYWVFLLLDKATGKIIANYAAQDHPAYGNGSDFDKLSHPFRDYDSNIHEIILIDSDQVKKIKEEVTFERTLLTIINEDYELDKSVTLPYKPLHSGKYLTEDKEGRQVQVKELVKTIPDYIKVRKLKKK